MAQQLIYIIDDEPALARIVQINLERAGYAVQTAIDGLEALQALQQKVVQPDLLLMDVMMPFMDGFDLLRQLQLDSELNPIPIIMMTARSRDEDMILAKSLGAHTYLTKPINPTELLTVVKEVFEKGETAPSRSVSTEFMQEN